jgi:hypothetical protein
VSCVEFGVVLRYANVLQSSVVEVHLGAIFLYDLSLPRSQARHFAYE